MGTVRRRAIKSSDDSKSKRNQRKRDQIANDKKKAFGCQNDTSTKRKKNPKIGRKHLYITNLMGTNKTVIQLLLHSAMAKPNCKRLKDVDSCVSKAGQVSS